MVVSGSNGMDDWGSSIESLKVGFPLKSIRGLNTVKLHGLRMVDTFLVRVWVLGKVFLEIERTANDHSGVFVLGIQVIGDGSVNDGHAAFVALRGGVGEIGAAVEFHDQADVGGVGVVLAGGDGADIAVLEVGLSGSGLVFGDVVNGEFRDPGFDFPHGREQ